MMNGDERRPQTFSWARRWSAGLNLVITVAAVVALVAMANYLAIRHYTRFHWSRDTEGALSRHTRHVLASLTNTVKIIVYADTRKEALFPRVEALLKEYEYASPRIQVQVVDYIRDGGTAKLIKEKYRLDTPTERNLVLFDMNGRTKVVSMQELSEYDYSKLLTGQTNEVERTHFKGELLFTSKIFSVANERSPVAYFLIGHNEHVLNVENPEGYGRFALMLTNENNFEIRVRTLSGTNEVPSDCSLLIIGGPSFSFDPSELEKIQRYLEQGGRMLVTFTSDTVQRRRLTGLERLLARWGVEVGDNVINDPEHSVQGWDVIPVNLGKHPVVNPIQSAQLQLFRPRSIAALQGARKAGDVNVEEMLFTGPNSVALTPSGGGWQEDASQRGARPLMVVVEKSVPNLQRGSTRIAVIGDSWIFNNTYINNTANHDFAGLTVNWLVNQSVLLGDIRPRPIHTYQLTMTQAQLRSVQIILLGGMPGAVLLVGVLVWMRRRN